MSKPRDTGEPGDTGRERKRRRFLPLVWLGSLTAAGIVALSVTGSISGFTASITNSGNSVGSGTLSLTETWNPGSGQVVCSTSLSGSTNTATCSTINKYGNNNVVDDTLYPGQSITTSVILMNTGSTPASSFTLTPGSCTDGNQGAPNGGGSLCTDLQVTAGCASGTTPPTAGTASGLAPAISSESPDALNTAGASTVTGGLASAASEACTFQVTLPSSVGNTDQYLTASQPLTWQIET